MQRYRDYLRREYDFRHSRNSAYSQRSFARDVGLHPARLSAILNEKSGLSPEKAREIGARLHLREDEYEHFMLLVTSQHARSFKERSSARKKLDERKQTYRKLEEGRFDRVGKWYAFAILELAMLENFQSSPSWIAEKLGIDSATVSSTIDALVEEELLRWEQDKLVPSRAGNRVGWEKNSRAIREFHVQILQKHKQAVLTESIEERYVQTAIVSASAADLPAIQREIDACTRRICAIADATPKKRDVYCITLLQTKLSKGE